MKSRAPLTLMEQLLTLVVFALAAALCLQVFVWADSTSRQSAARDQALVQAQSAAETLKGCGGDFAAAAEVWGGTWDGSVWIIRYDDRWQQTDRDGAYLLRVSGQESGVDYLGLARVEVFREDTCLASLDAAWQEVGAND